MIFFTSPIPQGLGWLFDKFYCNITLLTGRKDASNMPLTGLITFKE